MDTEKIKKFQKYFMWGFLALSFLLISPEVKGARKFFISLAWVLLVFRETADLMRNHRAWGNFIRILVILLFAPIAVTFILAGGDATIASFSKPAANESAHVIQMTYREGLKVYPTILRMWHLGDLRQFNGNFDSFYFVILGVVALSLIRLVWTGLRNAYEAARKKDLHKTVVPQDSQS